MSHKLLPNLKQLQLDLQQYSMVGQVFAAAKCVLRVVQVGGKHDLQDEFMDFCMLPFPPKVTAITEVDMYLACKHPNQRLIGN